ncbi:MAG: Tetratricopeptide repeat protein [Deltaproteobacteria bacterium]|nr:Tetratricopeptide repeat protein [Deltaproteobacteria bacterium]
MLAFGTEPRPPGSLGLGSGAAPKLASNQPASPTVVDRALAMRAGASHQARAEQLAKDVEAAAATDPVGAAILAYELGELCERRLRDEARALSAYRRALELDVSLRPNLWALRRVLYHRALWADLLELFDAELGDATDVSERVELLVERAVVLGHQGSSEAQARIALEAAIELDPRHQRALLELERVVTRTGDLPALLGVWERLAEAIEQPDRKVTYWLEVVRAAAASDLGRARAAFDHAAQLAESQSAPARRTLGVRVARERLRVADQYGNPADIEAAIEALAQQLIAATGRPVGAPIVIQPGEHVNRAFARRSELVALRRRQAQRDRAEQPLKAWDHLQQALALDPEEPVVVIELVELAAELGRSDDLVQLVQSGHAILGDAGLATMLSFWCAAAHLREDRREQIRALLKRLEATAPGFLLLTSSAECAALADPSRVWVPLDLAKTYLAAAGAAVRGSWLGPGAPLRPDPDAAAALYVQAADLLAYYVGTPATLEQAREALGKALEAAPEHPAVVEALTELDDTTGRALPAIARLRVLASAAAGPARRAIVERAIRLARGHGLMEVVLELERELVIADPDDCVIGWRLEATLFELGRDAERAALLGELARRDSDPARRRTALLGAARLHERAGAVELATDQYRQLLALGPQDGFARDALIGLLRQQARWVELVAERRAEAAAQSDGPAVRRALREAAWVLEILLSDVAQAADVYEAWIGRLPDDRIALEGLARCRAQLGDHRREVTVRAKIVELDPIADARWLFARSLERAGSYDQAAEEYRPLATIEDSLVAATSATLAIQDLAARAGDLAMRIEASDVLARRTTDPRLGAALFENSGWMYVVALDDFEHAAQSFSAALALQPTSQGALLGAALVAARQSGRLHAGEAYVQLASSVQMPDAAVALFLRGAAIAAATGDIELANERLESARTAAPDNINALFVAAEVGSTKPIDKDDPFAADDQLIARAEILGTRGSLIDDPAGRASWELDRAEALELAGQLREAATVVAAVLLLTPDDRRAALALRRMAHRAGDHTTWAHASCALAGLSRDPRWSLGMLRDAAGVFDQPGSAGNPERALATYRRIVALDPAAPESERLFVLVCEHGDARSKIEALTGRLTQLAAAPGTEPEMIPLLLERSRLLHEVGRVGDASADLDALLAHVPNNAEALRLRAALAIDAGDVDEAIGLWWKYLAVETDGPRRAEIELLLDQALKREDGLAPPPVAAPHGRTAPAFDEEPKTDLREPKTELREPKTDVHKVDREVDQGWDLETTDSVDPITAEIAPVAAPRETPPRADAPTPSSAQPATRRTPAIIRRTPTGMATAAPTVVDAEDPFAANTVRSDLSELQEQERRAAKAGAPDDYDLEITGDVPKLEPTVRDAQPASPAHAETGQAPDGRLVPPALDLAAVFRGAGPSLEGVDETTPWFDPGALQFAEAREMEPDDSAVVMLSFDQLHATRTDDGSAEPLLQYESEIAAIDDPATAVSLRIEAGRLCEALHDTDRASAHYEAALVANPHAREALRGLRRIARDNGDLGEVARLVDVELAIATGRERDALLRYRIDLLMATGELDVARVAVGELLDSAPLDISALLANLELMFVDDRAAEFAKALELLAHAVTDPMLRRAVQSARAVVAAHDGDQATAALWFAHAAASDPDSPATRLAAIRQAAAAGRGEAAGVALLDLACHVEGEDPITAAALAVRAQVWIAREVPTDVGRETMVAAAQLAARAAPRDPLVARVATETALLAGDSTLALHAFSRWARCKSTPDERAYAAARAAELEPTRLGRLWAQVLELDPGDDYAAAQLRAVHIDAGEADLATELDLQIAEAAQQDPPLLRAAAELLGRHQVDAALAVLVRGRDQRPASVAIAEALAGALAIAGRWSERAKLVDELAADPGLLAGEVARLRKALAWDRAVAAASTDPSASDEIEHATMAALDAWDLVLADDPRAPVAHAAAMVLARRLDDPGILAEVLVRAQSAEHSAWAASSLALRHARLLLVDDPRLAHDVAREAAPGLDDPRRTLTAMMAAAHRRDLGDAATALEDRAAQLDTLHEGAEGREAATLRLRAAQLALDAGDVPRATSLLARVNQALPGSVDDLVDAAARRASSPSSSGEGPPPSRGSFLRILREADLAAAQGAGAVAVELYQRALQLKPADALAAAPLIQIATQLRTPTPITELALDQLRSAEALGDTLAKAEAYELLARVELELRDDRTAAQIALESASKADPTRFDLMHRLERELIAGGRYRQLLNLREREVEQIRRTLPAGGAQDLAAMVMDSTTLAVRAKRSDAELAAAYRAALDTEPGNRLMLVHLESIACRAGLSDELVALDERISDTFQDPRARAAFLTRAGETLAGLGKPEEAVKRFARAVDALPSYLPALDAWHQTALDGELWAELAETAIHHGELGGDPGALAARYHFAGVALMDKASATEPAISMFRLALAADPGHFDAFSRLRTLFETTGKADELATLLRQRLKIEPDQAAQVELHRTLAEHGWNVGDRKAAMQHYRTILTINPADVRAHAAIADLATEHGTWQETADAVTARVRLETDPEILRTLHYRLGIIYGDHDPALASSAFQRALTYKPDDENVLIQLTDLAIRSGQWQVALDACKQLVTAEHDPEKLALHLHRAATIFEQGFHDPDRTERMLILALEKAPTSDDGLQRLVKFFRGRGDPMAMSVQLDRVAELMRLRIAHSVTDGVAYRVIARANAARAEAMGDGSPPIARAAAELAQLLGAGGEPEQRLVAGPPPVDRSLLVSPGHEVLFPRTLSHELRLVFRLLGEVLAKHIGVDLNVHGVGRKDRLRSVDPIAVTAREVATSFGFSDLDVYISHRQPYAMVAEPTNPVSLILGAAIAAGAPEGIRFAAGAALKLAQLSLAIPARLPPEELGIVTVAVLRLVQPELTSPGVDLGEVNARLPKLRRLISAGLLNDVRPHALAVTGFSHHVLARDLKIAGLRAGLVASGSILSGLSILAASVNTQLTGILEDPIVQALIAFALGEDRGPAPPVS